MNWWFTPAPALRLAALRVAVGIYGTIWALVRFPAHLDHTQQSAARWHPVGVLAGLGEPLPDAVVVGLAVLAPVLGLAYTAGWRFRISGPAFAVALTVLATLDSSWGQIFHTENLMVLHALIIAVAPAAPRDRQSLTAVHSRYGWPIRLTGLVLVLAYVVAGIAKLRLAGLGWAGGDVLRNLVAHDNLRKAVLGDTYSPIGTELVGFAWLFPPLAVVSLGVELGAGLALLGGRWRTVWVATAWGFHLGVLVLMAILFPYQLSGVAFLPLFRAERLKPLAWLARRASGRSGAPAELRALARDPLAPSG